MIRPFSVFQADVVQSFRLQDPFFAFPGRLSALVVMAADVLHHNDSKIQVNPIREYRLFAKTILHPISWAKCHLACG